MVEIVKRIRYLVPLLIVALGLLIWASCNSSDDNGGGDDTPDIRTPQGDVDDFWHGFSWDDLSEDEQWYHNRLFSPGG